MKKYETKVRSMLLNYCEALCHTKTKTLSKAAQIWKVRLCGNVSEFPKKVEGDIR
jgi:hypothetical protein